VAAGTCGSSEAAQHGTDDPDDEHDHAGVRAWRHPLPIEMRIDGAGQANA
jgi:hypothetical protein